MKKIISFMILIAICCCSCSAFAASYNIESVKETTTLEKVIDSKQGKIENKITKVDGTNLEVYGEVSFTNTVYESSQQKQLTEIYIMIPENIVEKTTQYELYKKYIEEFAQKVYSKNMNTKIGIIGIKGPVNSYTVTDDNLLMDNDDDEGDIPGSADNAEIVAELTDNIQNLKNGLSEMNPEKKKYYTNLQAAIGLARRSYSSGTNRILISLFDNVPLVCNGIQNSIQRTDEDDFSEQVKDHNDAIVSETKKEMMALKNNNISFILLRPDDTSYNQKWRDTATGEIILEYDGSQHVKDLYGTIENPTYGKMYSLNSDGLEKIVTQYIYEDVIEEIGTTLENIEIQVAFTKDIIDNFVITSLVSDDKTIDSSKLESDGKFIRNIAKLNEGETVTLKYKLKLKDSNVTSSILDKNISLNNILISLGDKSKDVSMTESPVIKVTQPANNSGNNGNNQNNSGNNSTGNNGNSNNDPTIAKENFPKAGKIVLAFALVSLIGCAGVGITKMINLRDVK